MPNVRIVVSALLVVFAFIVPGVLVANGNYWSALATFSIAIWMAMGVLLGEQLLKDKILLNLIPLVGTVASIFAPFVESPTTDMDLQKGYGSVLVDAVGFSDHCRPPKPGMIELQNYLVAACGKQQNAETMRLTMDAVKALYLPPSAALIDSAASAKEGKTVSQCARAYKIAASKCPESFIGVTKEERAALLKAAD